jgi:hypothetical protein
VKGCDTGGGRTEWRGALSDGDVAGWTPELRAALGRQAEDSKDDGVFWMPWEAVRAFFRYLHASWTPERFRFRACVHGRWTKSASDRAHRDANPQFLLRLAPTGGGGGEGGAGDGGDTLVWVLFQRHLRGDVPAPTKDAPGGEAGGEEGADVFAAVHVHRGAEKAYWPEAAEVASVYTDSPHALLRLPLGPAAGSAAVLVVSVLGPAPARLAYSITAYSVVPCSLAPVPPYPSYVLPSTAQAAQGRWEGAAAGGCPNHRASFGLNPAFAVSMAGAPGGGEARLWCKLVADAPGGPDGDDAPAVGMHLFAGRLEDGGGGEGRAEAVWRLDQVKPAGGDQVRLARDRRAADTRARVRARRPLALVRGPRRTYTVHGAGARCAARGTRRPSRRVWPVCAAAGDCAAVHAQAGDGSLCRF